MSQKPETRFRKRVVKDLKLLPNTVIHSIQQKAILGDPDLMLCVSGYFVALELKSETGKLSKLQKLKLDKIRAAGGLAFSVFPQDWDGIFKTVSKLAYTGEMK